MESSKWSGRVVQLVLLSVLASPCVFAQDNQEIYERYEQEDEPTVLPPIEVIGSPWYVGRPDLTVHGLITFGSPGVSLADVWSGRAGPSEGTRPDAGQEGRPGCTTGGAQ